jgi:protein-S-isoprenylcysteine O-methyltransferase Ste14
MATFTQHLLYHLAVLFAWAGGAAFVGSLLYLVYFYLRTLDSGGGSPADRPAHILIDTALFSLFAVHHSLFARSRAKQLVATIIPARLERSSYVWIASGLTVAMCALWQPVAGLLYRVDGVLRLLFWGVQLAGGLLVLGAARAISALDLAGIYQAAGRPASAEIKAAGPFGVVRHPIYLGWALMVFATPAMTADRLLFATLSTAYLILAIPWEEKSLVAGHGDRYRDYQRQVRWRLIPGVW